MDKVKDLPMEVIIEKISRWALEASKKPGGLWWPAVAEDSENIADKLIEILSECSEPAEGHTEA
jgi:hypothetical protein